MNKHRPWKVSLSEANRIKSILNGFTLATESSEAESDAEQESKKGMTEAFKMTNKTLSLWA